MTDERLEVAAKAYIDAAVLTVPRRHSVAMQAALDAAAAWDREHAPKVDAELRDRAQREGIQTFYSCTGTFTQSLAVAIDAVLALLPRAPLPAAVTIGMATDALRAWDRTTGDQVAKMDAALTAALAAAPRLEAPAGDDDRPLPTPTAAGDALAEAVERWGKLADGQGATGLFRALAAYRASPAAPQDVADTPSMAEALRRCATQFEFYAVAHMKAGKHEKALTNRQFAEIARAALAGREFLSAEVLPMPAKHDATAETASEPAAEPSPLAKVRAWARMWPNPELSDVSRGVAAIYFVLSEHYERLRALETAEAARRERERVVAKAARDMAATWAENGVTKRAWNALAALGGSDDGQ